MSRSGGIGRACHASGENVPACLWSRATRVGHDGAIGAKQAGGTTSSRLVTWRPEGTRFGTVTRPQPSACASSPIGTPTGFDVSGPPAARSHRSGIFAKRPGCESVPSSLKCRSPVMSMALSISATVSRAMSAPTAIPCGA